MFKLREIIEFCENYSNLEEKEIAHFSRKDAAIRKKQHQLKENLDQQEIGLKVD